ncbi:MAG TPA: hypothetical protein VGF48_16145 [Thermoanaerobaculia bacterium]|jgi:hypothetical protein
MIGSILVEYSESRDVYVDNTKCGLTNEPFDVETGTHDIDLGEPVDYSPHTKKIRVRASDTSLNPQIVRFTHEGDLL